MSYERDDHLWSTHTFSFTLHIPLCIFFEILIRGTRLFWDPDYGLLIHDCTTSENLPLFQCQSFITVQMKINSHLLFAFAFFWRLMIVCHISLLLSLPPLLLHTAINNFNWWKLADWSSTLVWTEIAHISSSAIFKSKLTLVQYLFYDQIGYKSYSHQPQM